MPALTFALPAEHFLVPKPPKGQEMDDHYFGVH